MTDWRLKDTVDAILLRIINGARAFTFQNYTEVNVKTGAQRVASAILTVNAATPNTDHVFTIGNPGTGNATVHWWLTFFEGEPDLP